MGIFDFLKKKDSKNVTEDQQRTKARREAEMTINYGQVRTMADILIAMDAIHHFKNASEAISAVEQFISAQDLEHNSISAKAFNVIADTLSISFINGSLDDSVIKRLFDRSYFNEAWDNALYKYYYAKIWKLICYFNDFRQYSSPDQIINDLHRVLSPKYFVLSDSAWGIGGYPRHFFSVGVRKAWPEIAQDGKLNGDLLIKYMFTNHENAIKTIGLEETINNCFIQDPCHTEVFFPKLIGTAPVYIEHLQDCAPRRFIKSCGEGKGPNAFPESLEMRLSIPLLLDDPKYTVFGEYDGDGDFKIMYFVPLLNNDELPVYSNIQYREYGKVYFKSRRWRYRLIEQLKDKLIIADDDLRKQLIDAYRPYGNFW